MSIVILEPPTQEHFRFPPKQGEWTFENYVDYIPDDGERYEVIEGDLYMMAAPTPDHQTVVKNISFEIELLIRSKKIAGTVFVAPIDLVMEDVASPVQPDICFVSAENTHLKVERTHLRGIPDLVVEVLSTDVRRDRVEKFAAYRKAGIHEYWIVDPVAETVDVYVLRGNAYVPVSKFSGSDLIRSEIIRDWSVNVNALF